MGNADNVLFDNDSRVAPLGLIAMAGASELGKKVDGYLTKWANENEFVKDTFLVEAVCRTIHCQHYPLLSYPPILIVV